MNVDELKILEEYRYTLMEIEAISKQIDRLRIPMEPGSIGAAPMGEKMPSTNDKIHASIQQLDGLDTVLKKRKRVLERQTLAFESVLAGVKDSRTRTVLRLYYGLGYSDEMIARNMGVSRTTVWSVRAAVIPKPEGNG